MPLFLHCQKSVFLMMWLICFPPGCSLPVLRSLLVTVCEVLLQSTRELPSPQELRGSQEAQDKSFITTDFRLKVGLSSPQELGHPSSPELTPPPPPQEHSLPSSQELSLPSPQELRGSQEAQDKSFLSTDFRLKVRICIKVLKNYDT